MSKSCDSCGMPLVDPADFALGNTESEFCCHCVDAIGQVKSGEEIFEGGVRFFMDAIGEDRLSAERITRKNMKMQPYWILHPFPALDGEVASDEEFHETLKRLV